MVTEQIVYSFGWAPWSSIIAGGLSALAISVILAIFGVALGFTVVSPKSDDPTSGLGVAFGVWGVISVIVSTGAGGFVAGLLAGQRGLEIGFLVWVLTVLGGVLFSGVAVGMAVRAVGSAVSGMGSAVVTMGTGAANVAGSVGKGALQSATSLFEELQEKFDIDIDLGAVNDNVVSALRDSGIETIQPEYLQGQFREARTDFMDMAHDLAMNPSDHEQIIGKFLDGATARIDKLTGNLDRDSAVTALMNTRTIPKEEAEKIVDNALKAYDDITQKAKASLAEARARVEQARMRLRQMADRARAKADKLASAAAKSALAAGVALLIAAAICMGAALCGERYASSVYPVAAQVQNTTIAR